MEGEEEHAIEPERGGNKPATKKKRDSSDSLFFLLHRPPSSCVSPSFSKLKIPDVRTEMYKRENGGNLKRGGNTPS